VLIADVPQRRDDRALALKAALTVRQSLQRNAGAVNQPVASDHRPREPSDGRMPTDEDWHEQRRLEALARADQIAQKAQNSVPVEQRRPWLGARLAG